MFRLLPKELAAEVFVEMEPEEQEVLIKSFSDTELREVLEELYVDDTVDLIEEMPASVVKRILRHTDPETRRSVNEILRYPEDSAGSMEDFVMGQAAAGSDETIPGLIAALAEVTPERVRAAAKSVKPDTIYFLKGKEGCA